MISMRAGSATWAPNRPKTSVMTTRFASSRGIPERRPKTAPIWSAVLIAAGPRGARGQIWRLDVGPASYALKEIFADPPSEALIAAELDFGRRAATTGVRLPGSHPDRDGRYLFPSPTGTQLRLYDWVDLQPVDLAAQGTPQELGALLARLHQCAPTAAEEVEGGPPARWYDRVPAAQDWLQASASGSAWSPRLADLLSRLPELCATVRQADSVGLIVCHRDLHPENVLADPTGALVVLDWDNLGPAAPERELGRALFDWFSDGWTDLDAARNMYDAYVRADGPGRIAEPADFSMLLASRLNFLLRQVGVAIDPAAADRHRRWAEREIDEALRIMPTQQQLEDVMELARAY